MISPYRLLPLWGLCLISLSLAGQAEQPSLRVNQAGYDLQGPRRFSAPWAQEGAPFHITLEGREETAFEGIIEEGMGDFSPLQTRLGPTTSWVVRMKDPEGKALVSPPFHLALQWPQELMLEQVAVPGSKDPDTLLARTILAMVHPSYFQPQYKDLLQQVIDGEAPTPALIALLYAAPLFGDLVPESRQDAWRARVQALDPAKTLQGERSSLLLHFMLHTLAQREGWPDAGRYLESMKEQVSSVLHGEDPLAPGALTKRGEDEALVLSSLVVLLQQHPDAMPEILPRALAGYTRAIIQQAEGSPWDTPALLENAAPTSLIAYAGLFSCLAEREQDPDVARRMDRLATGLLDRLYGRNPEGEILFDPAVATEDARALLGLAYTCWARQRLVAIRSPGNMAVRFALIAPRGTGPERLATAWVEGTTPAGMQRLVLSENATHRDWPLGLMAPGPKANDPCSMRYGYGLFQRSVDCKKFNE